METSFQVERKPLCFHIKSFSKSLSKYRIQLRETYASEESNNQWKHTVINEGKVIQTNQKLNQYIHNQTNLQQISPYNWIGAVKQVNIVIKKQESMSIQVVGLMSKVSSIVSFIPQNRFFMHVEGYIKEHLVGNVFKDCESLTHDSSWK